MFEKGQLQHNIGVPFREYGIKHIVEPVKELYKDEIREVARVIGLPKEISERAPFPGPGLIIRCLGKINKEKIELIREGLAIAEEELAYLNPFQVVVAISSDQVCSMIDRAIPDKYMLIIRAVESEDAMTAEGIIPSRGLKNKLEEKLMGLSGNKVGRVLWDLTNKPKGTIEYI
jgi:GMP synthase (glutamine-hydrolysing)